MKRRPASNQGHYHISRRPQRWRCPRALVPGGEHRARRTSCALRAACSKVDGLAWRRFALKKTSKVYTTSPKLTCATPYMPSPLASGLSNSLPAAPPHTSWPSLEDIDMHGSYKAQSPGRISSETTLWNLNVTERKRWAGKMLKSRLTTSHNASQHQLCILRSKGSSNRSNLIHWRCWVCTFAVILTVRLELDVNCSRRPRGWRLTMACDIDLVLILILFSQTGYVDFKSEEIVLFACL
jgi:hypothetical protein